MKVVHDVVASELDWIRLTERLETERSMSTEMTEDAKLEVDLRLSLFREGLRIGVTEVTSNPCIAGLRFVKNFDDADWAAGYSAGSVVAEQALSQYRAALVGGGK